MATRGPKPSAVLIDSTLSATLPHVSVQDRENPDKLTGEALRVLAHKKGLARSSLPSMSDEKIREQLRYLTSTQYENAVE